jgi:hypothetical protein
MVVEEEKNWRNNYNHWNTSIHDFELTQEDVTETEQEMPKEPVQISFEDLLGGNYHDTQFVKVQEIKDTPKRVWSTLKEIIERRKKKL